MVLNTFFIAPILDMAHSLNADYVEARLLEAAALQQLQRLQEAAQSLESLLEAGRRTDHWLIASPHKIRARAAKKRRGRTSDKIHAPKIIDQTGT